MTRRWSAVALVLAGLLCAAPAVLPEPAPTEAAEPLFPEVKWVRDYGEAKAEAERAGKPLWVVIRCER